MALKGTNSKPFVFDGTGEAKRHAPATARNRDAIASVIGKYLPKTGTILEIASGTGEHLVHFARTFPQLLWQPSDYDQAGLASINAWASDSGLDNILPPIRIDAASTDWPIEQADGILCINMIHISPWEATMGLISGSASRLSKGAPLYLYGPYIQKGVPTVESNLAFDRSLRDRNAAWGLRSVEDVVEYAKQKGIMLQAIREMPSNNLSLVFSKD